MPDVPICEEGKHVPFYVYRGRRPAIVICEICHHKLNTKKKEAQAENQLGLNI